MAVKILGLCGAQPEANDTLTQWLTMCAGVDGSNTLPTQLHQRCATCEYANVAQSGLTQNTTTLEPAGIMGPDSTLPQAPVQESVAAVVHKRDAQAAENMLTIDLTNIKLPDETTIDIDAVLKGVLGAEGGPSEGGVSPHKLEPYMLCERKGYWASVRGLTRKTKPSYFSIGSAFHAAMELYFGGGGRRDPFEVTDALLAAGAPEMAGQVKRMIHSYLGKYGVEMAACWDIRAIEQQFTHFEGPFRIGGKSMYLPMTCRIDLLTALLNPGQPRQPYGHHPNGVWMLDYKTASRYDANLVSSYNRNVQFRMNAYIFAKSHADKWGKLNGVIVDIVLKKRKIDKQNGAERLQVSVSDVDLQDVEDYYVRCAYELAAKAADATYAKDYRMWDCNDAACQGKYGPCPYYDLCDYGESMVSQYRVAPSHIVDPSKFLQPQKQELQRRKDARIKQAEEAGVETAETKRKKNTELRKENKALVLHFIETEEDRPFHLVKPSELSEALENEKQPVVRKLVAQIIQDRCAGTAGTKYIMMVGAEDAPEELGITYKETGLSWQFRSMKGTLSWSVLAKYLTRHWWDPATNETSSASRK